MTIKSMDLSWVVVKDLDAAISFLTNVVGLELQEKNDMFSWAELSGLEGGGRLGVAKTNDTDNMPAGVNAVVTMSVDDIEAKKLELEGKNVTMIGDILEIPGIIKLQMFVDQDGNRFQLAEEEV
jgi:predicted enzyme related to lactoylglutathione lyase